MTFSIATWNINSVRLRIDLVTRYLAEHQPDVLCLQETKCPDANFPFAAFRDAGYPHIAINGQKGYHGVAVVSRVPFAASAKRDFCAKGDARHLHVVLGDEANGLELHNFYVPAGGDEPDPEINAKFAHKLAFVDEMADWGRDEKPAAGRSILVGDLNIAPLEHDVWSHKALLSVVSHTPIEVDKLRRAQAAGPWVDALAQIRARRPEALHVVELSLVRLVEDEQGAAPRPHLGQPGARRRRQVDARPARRPRLGSAPPTTRR